jgi:putative ABC transport system permease protein
VIRFLFRSLQRQIRQSRTLFALAVIGVALGVASVVAIQTLNQGALLAFDGSVRAISGQAELSVVGTTPAFAESLLVPVLADADVKAAWPICRVDAAVRGRPGLLLDLVGVDLLAPVRFPTSDMSPETDASFEAGADIAANVVTALTSPGWVALTPDLARAQGWTVGDTLTVSSGSRIVVLTVGALVDFQAVEPLAPRTLAVMDIAQVQGRLARKGLVHQIDIQLVEGADPQRVSARLERALGPGVRVQTPEQRSQDAEGLLAAFRLNLTALSLISVFVGLFLVLTSVQASLARRRREFGLLRCLGASPGQTVGLVVAESGFLGVLGTMLGIPLGYVVALRNLDTVSATLTSIYVLEGVDRLVLPPEVILLGAVVGILGAMAGAVWPALEMTRRDTLQLLAPVTMHEQAGRFSGRLTWIAGLLAAVGSLWFFLGGADTRWGGFAYGAVMLISLPLVVPLVVRSAGKQARPRGMGLSLSVRNLVARLHTTSFAIAALAVTVSMLVGITILVGSFRQTLTSWLDVTIRADVYLTSQSWVRAGEEAFLDRWLLDEIANDPAVAAVEEQRRLRIATPDGRFRVWLNGIKVAGLPGTELVHRLPLQQGEAADVARRLEAGEVLIGEPLARKGALAIGDTLDLAGPAGPIRLRIAGVAYDYTSEGGTAFVTMSTLDQFFPAGPPNNVAIFLRDGEPVDETVARLRIDHRELPLIFRSNRDLRREILAIFDQTFAVTRTLQTLALLTAVFGVSLTLLVQSRERTGELALLRSLGANRRQVFGLFLGEGATMGLLGLMMGLIGGLGLAMLLILNVNRQWFGWTIQAAWPGVDILRQSLTVMAATVIAAVIPAAKAGLAGPEQLSRDDL